jgi:hypothetical protein
MPLSLFIIVACRTLGVRELPAWYVNQQVSVLSLMLKPHALRPWYYYSLTHLQVHVCFQWNNNKANKEFIDTPALSYQIMRSYPVWYIFHNKKR